MAVVTSGRKGGSKLGHRGDEAVEAEGMTEQQAADKAIMGWR
jgi:hypothetical protein